MAEEDAGTLFMSWVEAINAAGPPTLSALGAGLLAALHLDVASDSRTFSRLLGIEHALVLREITGLSAEGGLLTVLSRDPRTQRTRIAPSKTGAALIAAAERRLCPSG